MKGRVEGLNVFGMFSGVSRRMCDRNYWRELGLRMKVQGLSGSWGLEISQSPCTIIFSCEKLRNVRILNLNLVLRRLYSSR